MGYNDRRRVLSLRNVPALLPVSNILPPKNTLSYSTIHTTEHYKRTELVKNPNWQEGDQLPMYNGPLNFAEENSSMSIAFTCRNASLCQPFCF